MSQSDHDHDGQWCAAHRWLASTVPVEQVPVASLQRGYSPRLDGESKDSALAFQYVAAAPPIIVHRPSMQIIDGNSRWTAALNQHQDAIAVRFFDGTADEAYVLAVVTNTFTHGRRLSRQARKAAAERLLGMYPDWSDRMIAATTDLSHPTIGVIRRKLSTGKNFQLTTRRRGRDGKLRPATNSTRGRIVRNPVPANDCAAAHQGGGDAAGSAHVGPGAAARPVPGVEQLSSTTCGAVSDSRLRWGYGALKQLWADPALHGNKGAALMQLLWDGLRLAGKAPSLTAGAPEHLLDTIADVESAIGESWIHSAGDLHRKCQLHSAATHHPDKGSRRGIGRE